MGKVDNLEKQEILLSCSMCEEKIKQYYNEELKICDHCFEEHHCYCGRCDEVLYNEDAEYVEYETFCEDCFLEEFNYCYSCGEVTHRDYSIWRDDVVYCEPCEPSETEDMIYNLENKETPIYSRESDTFDYNIRRLVGIEVECIIPDTESIWNPKHWRDVGDGSISAPEEYSGVEMVSTPASGDLLINTIDKLMFWKKEYNAFVNRSCGLHIHFNSIDMSPREIAHIGMVYSKFQDILKGMMPNSRQKSNWTRDFSINYNILKSINSEKDLIDNYYEYMDSHPSTDKYNEARYCGLNLHSRYYHGSIEFRLHSGTINKKKIVNWISICNIIIEKGIEISKFSKENIDAWIKLKPNTKIFGDVLEQYINKRTEKFKGER